MVNSATSPGVQNYSLWSTPQFGRLLYQKVENGFVYNGIPLVEIKFLVTNNKVISLMIHEPDVTVTAIKVS